MATRGTSGRQRRPKKAETLSQRQLFEQRKMPALLLSNHDFRTTMELVGEAIVAETWEAAGEEAGLAKADQPPPPQWLDPVKLGAFRVALVRMPPPLHTTECYLLALAVPAPTPRKAKSVAHPRYLTFEQRDPGGAPGTTMLCEWTATGARLTLGPGPEPEPDAVLVAIAKLLEGG
jgi:hypothetical protein